MANCYGTKEYATFRLEQFKLGDGGEWTLNEERTERYKDYELKYTTYSSSLKTNDNFVYNHGVLSVYRCGELIYSCKDMYEDYPAFFYFYTLNGNGNDYLMFRKDDLYGYTILNLDTAKEYNYFPDIVLNREQESFIIVEATLWKDVLLLFGCYWAFPYMYYALDTKTHKVLLLSERGTDETKTEINGETLKLHFYDEEKPETETFTYTDLAKLLEDSETYDI